MGSFVSATGQEVGTARLLSIPGDGALRCDLRTPNKNAVGVKTSVNRCS